MFCTFVGMTSYQFRAYLKNPNEHSFFLREAEPHEVFKLLSDLNKKKPYKFMEYPQNSSKCHLKF